MASTLAASRNWNFRARVLKHWSDGPARWLSFSFSLSLSLSLSLCLSLSLSLSIYRYTYIFTRINNYINRYIYIYVYAYMHPCIQMTLRDDPAGARGGCPGHRIANLAREGVDLRVGNTASSNFKGAWILYQDLSGILMEYHDKFYVHL